MRPATRGQEPAERQRAALQFDYTYDREGQFQTLTKNYPGLTTSQRYDLGYDNADQLQTAPLKNAATNALIKQYTYGYDLASNRTSERVANKTTTSTPNSVNEITSQSGATSRTLTYDLNGSLINDGATRTFEWDGANRLVAVNYIGTTNRSEFSYDGLNRCVKILEKTSGVVTSTRKLLWCNQQICEYLGATNNVQVMFFGEGQYQSNVPYFYMRDHLGSIREMTDASGTVVARYDYDLWGRSTTVISTIKPDFNFTGLYQHAKSSLDMATRRFYDPDLGRWLSRDPSGETGGINLYSYGSNNSVNLTDLAGLCPGDWWDVRTWFNQGLTDSLDDTWTSLQDVAGDFLTGNWDRLAADAAGNPLGQTENNPAAYWTVAGSLGASFLAVGSAIGLEAAGIESRVAFHEAHHTFEGLGPRAHLQINIWQTGIKGSGQVIRIPFPPW